eukprot:12926822-Alexandrium_andersonii.AAC.1
MIGNSTIGQHVLAIVTEATFSEARLEARKRIEEKLKRKRKRDIDASLLSPAAGAGHPIRKAKGSPQGASTE